jgi:hypothetical protein
VPVQNLLETEGTKSGSVVRNASLRRIVTHGRALSGIKIKDTPGVSFLFYPEVVRKGGRSAIILASHPKDRPSMDTKLNGCLSYVRTSFLREVSDIKT